MYIYNYIYTIDYDTLSIFIQPNNSHIIAIGNPYPTLPCPSSPFLALHRQEEFGSSQPRLAVGLVVGDHPLVDQTDAWDPDLAISRWSLLDRTVGCGHHNWIYDSDLKIIDLYDIYGTVDMIIDVVTLKTKQLMRHHATHYSVCFLNSGEARNPMIWSHWWLSWSSARISSGVRDT